MKKSYRPVIGMVKLARVVAGLTQEEVGGLLHPPRPGVFICRIERRGSARITRGIANDLARVLGSSIEELFEAVCKCRPPMNY